MGLDLLARLAAEARAFAPLDVLTIGTLALLEGILSVDNALVLAILVRGLPQRQQKKALFLGIVGAFGFRFLALVFASHLMRLAVFKLIGGGYLIYLAMKHMFFFSKEEAYQATSKAAGSLWKTVLLVELTDLAFSIDSITAAVAMADKLLIVWTGGVLGIVFLRFAAKFFMTLLERLPRLEDLAYQLVFFVGTKLTLEGFHLEIDRGVFWLMMGVITVLGSSLVYRDYFQRRTHRSYSDRLIEGLEKSAITLQDLVTEHHVPAEVIARLVEKGYLLVPGPSDRGGAAGPPNPAP